jgi:hypothetical protein
MWHRLLFALILAQAAMADVPGVRIPRVVRAPKLEDFLSGTPREAEAVVSDFYQREPGDGAEISQPTTAYLSYDDRNIYVVYVCKDDPNLIRARMVKRDAVYHDDRVTVGFDTYHDHRRAYWFDLNPYNIQGDGIVIDGVEDSSDWDAVWRSEARITADGYVAFLAIPFKMLRFSGEELQTWGLFLGRIIGRNNETSLWPHISKRQPGWVQQSGDMSGLENISPGRNIQLIPYGFLSGERYWSEPRYRTENEVRGGLDAKMVIKESFTLDVALNPDFSQVESDEPQVTVNQRYEVVYPEKRPFFLENAGLFLLPQRLFFSRRIVDPQFGVRLTGKWGRWSMGILGTDDRAPGAIAGESDSTFGKRAFSGVFRLQREFADSSTIGAIATTRNFGSAYNRVAGLDAHLRVLPNWFLSGQAVSSETRGRDGALLSGPSYRVGFEHSGRHFISSTAYSDVSPSFRAELGYIPRVDIRQLSHTAGYKWRPEESPLKSFGPETDLMVNFDRTGRVQDWQINQEFGLEFKRLTFLNFGHNELFELYGNRGFRRRHNEFEADTQWFRWMELKASWEKGTSVNYYPAAGLKPSLANSTEASIGLTLLPLAQLRLENSYIYSSLHGGSGNGGASLFTNHIFRSKANYQFSPALSLRAIMDYQAVLPNTALVSMEPTKFLGGDVLLTYMLHPGTALHVGYTDQYDNWRFDPTLSPAMRRTAFPDFSTGRQFFVKISYLLHM